MPTPANPAQPLEPDVLGRLFPKAVGGAAIRLGDRELPLFDGEAEAVRKAVEKRRREFAGGRHCARLAMVAIGRAPCAVPRGPDRAPIWPPGLVGSITHSGDFCAAVVADDELFQSIGIDAQPIGSVSARLAGHVIGPEDVSPSDEATDAVDWPTLHFCLKEAAYKAYYPMRRRRLGFHDMRLVIAPEARTFVAETIGQDSGLAFNGQYAVHDGRIHGACWYA